MELKGIMPDPITGQGDCRITEQDETIYDSKWQWDNTYIEPESTVSVPKTTQKYKNQVCLITIDPNTRHDIIEKLINEKVHYWNEQNYELYYIKYQERVIILIFRLIDYQWTYYPVLLEEQQKSYEITYPQIWY